MNRARVRSGWLVLLLAAARGFGVANDVPLAAFEAGLPPMRSFTRLDMGEEAGPQVFSMVQDPRGVLFLANNAGVLEHDAVSFRLHRLPTRSTPLSLGVDAAGTVYVGAGDDLGLLEGSPTGGLRFRSLMRLIPKGAPPVKDVWQILTTPDGAWFRTEAALYRYHGGRIDVVPTKTKLKIGGSAGGLHLVREMDVGLLRLAGGRAELLPGSEALGSEKIFFICPFDGDRVLLGARSGLLLLDPLTGRRERFATGIDDELARAEVYAGVRLGDGTIAIGTSWKGVYVVDRQGKRILHLDRASGLPDEEVFSLLVDRDGALWIGFNNGLARVEVPSPLTHVSARQGLTGFVEGMARGPDGLYLATSEGVKVLRAGPRGPVVEKVAGISEMTWDVERVGSRILAATDDGLFSIEPHASAPRVSRLRAGAHREVLLSGSSPGRVALGVGDGLVVVGLDDQGRLRNERRIEGIASACLGLAEEPDGTLWAGTESQGAYRVRLEGAAPLLTGFETDPGYAYPFTLAGNVVFGTTGGLRRPDAAARRLVPDSRLGTDLADGSVDVFRVFEDPAGRVFVRASSTRVLRRDATGVYRVESGPLSRLPASVQVMSFLAEETDGRSVTWIGTRDGLYRLDWSVPRLLSPGLPGLVRRVVVPGREPLFDGFGRVPLSLPFSRAALRLEYAATAFEAPAATLYRTWLEGYEDEPSGETRETRRDFTNLPEGSYRFHVRAVDLMGRATQQASPLELVVRPPWHRTPWAYALWTALSAAGLWGLVQLRLRALRSRTRELEEAVLRRTMDLAESNRKLSDAHARIASLVQTSGRAQEDLADWARTACTGIAESVGARAVEAFAIERDRVEPLTATAGGPAAAAAPSSVEELQLAIDRSARAEPGISPFGREHAALSSCPGERRDEVAIGARGAAGELLGAVVARGVTTWGEAERRLLEGFAHQLGGALEMRRIRRRLATAESARAALRSDMERRGILMLRVCPTCQRCYASTSTACAGDLTPLESSRLLPYRLLDRYRLDRVLGEGGMGTVFLARDERLRREVAIKVIRPELFDDPSVRARFDREAQAVARINHPGVVSLFDSGALEDGSAFLVMERLQGLDLAALLERHGAGTPAQVARLARQGGAALSAAHRAGVVHRDIKPENVVLAPAPGGFSVKIVDFGLAKEMSAGAGLTRTGMVVGTPWYMAPEQVEGLSASGRSDLYSFATVLYEALTGARAVAAESLGQVFRQVVRSEAPPPSTLRPGLSPAVDRVLGEALRKAPHERPSDVEAWAARLASVLEKEAPCGAGWPEPIGGTTPSPDVERPS